MCAEGSSVCQCGLANKSKRHAAIGESRTTGGLMDVLNKCIEQNL